MKTLRLLTLAAAALFFAGVAAAQQPIKIGIGMPRPARSAAAARRRCSR